MGITKFFTSNAQARTTNQIIADYSTLYPRARGGRLTAAESEQFVWLSNYLQHHLVLAPVSASGDDADLHAQLVRQDRVHNFGVNDSDELKTFRLGDPLSSSKTAYALINPRNADGDREVLAAIYTYWQRGGQCLAGHYNALAGKVDRILFEPVQHGETDTPQAAIFFSISAFNGMKGAGQMLIDTLHSRLTTTMPAGTVLSTLSPLRGLREWMNERGLTAQPDPSELRRAAYDYLLDNKDGVQRFHMGNGAMIGAIRLGANAPGSEDDRLGANVMVNYIYDPDPARLAAHRVQYQNAVDAAKQGPDFAAKAMIFSLMDLSLQREGHPGPAVQDTCVAVPAFRPA